MYTCSAISFVQLRVCFFNNYQPFTPPSLQVTTGEGRPLALVCTFKGIDQHLSRTNNPLQASRKASSYERSFQLLTRIKPTVMNGKWTWDASMNNIRITLMQWLHYSTHNHLAFNAVGSNLVIIPSCVEASWLAYGNYVFLPLCLSVHQKAQSGAVRYMGSSSTSN